MQLSMPAASHEEKSWLLHSQRSAAVVLALMALEPNLRDEVVNQVRCLTTRPAVDLGHQFRSPKSLLQFQL